MCALADLGHASPPRHSFLYVHAALGKRDIKTEGLTMEDYLDDCKLHALKFAYNFFQKRTAEASHPTDSVTSKGQTCFMQCSL